MRITKLYYLLGGKENSYLRRKWIEYKQNKKNKYNRKLLQKIGNEALDAMAAACCEANVPYWLEFGTLLGAYREHGFIHHDDDIDISMWAEDCTRDFENLLLKYGFYKKRAFYLFDKQTNVKTLTEIALSYKGLQVDIFFNYKKNINQRSCYAYCTPVIDKKMTAREFILPNFDKTERICINNNYYFAPNNTKETLTMLYGSDFMIPKEGANATKSVNKNIVVHDIKESYGIGYLLS